MNISICMCFRNRDFFILHITSIVYYMNIPQSILNNLLDREKIYSEILDIIRNFYMPIPPIEPPQPVYTKKGKLSVAQQKKVVTDVRRRGIYIYGPSGVGKTSFATSLVKDNNYSSIIYAAGDVRNADMMEELTTTYMSSETVLSAATLNVANKQKMVVILDELDGMTNMDKGGIESLIKIIRPKKTAKQKKEKASATPIICIGNCKHKKKIMELMKVCHVIFMDSILDVNILKVVNWLIAEYKLVPLSSHEETKLLEYSQGDLRKIFQFMGTLRSSNAISLDTDLYMKITCSAYDSRKATGLLFERKYPMEEHSDVINETDRTTVALLWHENLPEYMCSLNNSADFVEMYCNQLSNICIADYVDRITFQQQIWQFNELTSLMKTFHNHAMYHKLMKSQETKQVADDKKRSSYPITFTKMLSKYSTEYNNLIFMNNVCHKRGTNRNLIYEYFYNLHKNLKPTDNLSEIIQRISAETGYETLELMRLYRLVINSLQLNGSTVSNSLDEMCSEGTFEDFSDE